MSLCIHVHVFLYVVGVVPDILIVPTSITYDRVSSELLAIIIVYKLCIHVSHLFIHTCTCV